MTSRKKNDAFSAQVSIKDLCGAMDRKDRGFYDSLTEQQKKKFSGYLALRYASILQGNKDLQTYYLMATNLLANKKFFDISNNHAKLQWLVLTTISPNMGIYYHPWIGVPSNKNKEHKTRLKVLAKFYPNEKMQDLELYEELMTDEEYKEILEKVDDE